jgi:hypothetical protein
VCLKLQIARSLGQKSSVQFGFMCRYSEPSFGIGTDRGIIS